MASSRDTLKAWFLTGEKPTQGQFAELINSCFNWNDDTLYIPDINGLTTALAGKLSVDTLLSSWRAIVPMTDARLTNAAGVWTLNWDMALQNQFGTDEATIKVLFDNGGGTFKEQKAIQPIYNYTAGKVSSITLELMIPVTFKLIITI